VTLEFAQFVPDVGKPIKRPDTKMGQSLVDGVTIRKLAANSDDRGALFELLSVSHGPFDPIVHVYQVFAEAGSIRAWVYHEHQSDRLAFTNGRYQLVLHDLRPESVTYGALDVLEVGELNPCLITLPPYVIHGLQNVGDTRASFINMPTRAYNPLQPDKCRLPWDDDRIPFSFKK
jgi:dTDP-4-dehydrorhamnose 3,5-epimerase